MVSAGSSPKAQNQQQVISAGFCMQRSPNEENKSAKSGETFLVLPMVTIPTTVPLPRYSTSSLTMSDIDSESVNSFFSASTRDSMLMIHERQYPQVARPRLVRREQRVLAPQQQQQQHQTANATDSSEARFHSSAVDVVPPCRPRRLSSTSGDILFLSLPPSPKMKGLSSAPPVKPLRKSSMNNEVSPRQQQRRPREKSMNERSAFPLRRPRRQPTLPSLFTGTPTGRQEPLKSQSFCDANVKQSKNKRSSPLRSVTALLFRRSARKTNSMKPLRHHGVVQMDGSNELDMSCSSDDTASVTSHTSVSFITAKRADEYALQALTAAGKGESAQDSLQAYNSFVQELGLQYFVSHHGRNRSMTADAPSLRLAYKRASM